MRLPGPSLALAVLATPSWGLAAARGHQEVPDDSNVALTIVTEQSPVTGIQVGSFEGGADVVFGSHVQQGWSVGSPAVIGPAESATQLFATLPPGLRLRGADAVSEDPGRATARVLRHEDAAIPGLDAAAPLNFEVAYECLAPGATHLKLQLDFEGGAPLEVGIVKECSSSARQGLALGTAPERPDDVVAQGEARWTTVSATQRLVPATTNQLQMFLSLRQTGGADDSTSQMVAPLQVRALPLATGALPQAGPTGATLKRWHRSIKSRAYAEAAGQRKGRWGLLQENAVADKDQIVEVHLTGTAAKGGQLRLAPNEDVPGAQLNVELTCLQGGAALVELEVGPYPAYQPYRPTVVSFVKLCGGAVGKGFYVGTSNLAMDVHAAEDANLIRDGRLVGRMVDLGNRDAAIGVSWRSEGLALGPPTASRLQCSGGIVAASLPQPTVTLDAEGILAGRQNMRFSCIKAGKSKCQLDFGWSLHQGPSLEFHKTCGGEREDVDVTSDDPSKPPVLLQGLTDDAWSLNPLAWTAQVSLPAEEDSTSFTVSLDEALRPGEEALKIDPPQIRVFSPDVVRAYVVGELAQGALLASDPSKGSIPSAELDVKMQCLATGMSKVEITLPIGAKGEGFKPLNFAFQKQCLVVSYWQQPWVMGMAAFVGLFFMSSTVMLTCICRMQPPPDPTVPRKKEFLRTPGGIEARAMRHLSGTDSGNLA